MDQISPGLQSALASWVNTKNMQPIVDKITPLIWTDINIVNADSIIVASSKPYRIGKYHNAAHMLLDTDQDELIIEHTNDVPGVLHGVNYPMIINGARVGMIGITGVPSEVQLIARLVRELLQVSISQARKDQEKSYLDQERYMFHSDRGFQYTNRTFHHKLVQAGMTQSMSRVAHCIDNGPMEGFWGILKRERYYGRRFTSKHVLVQMIQQYSLLQHKTCPA